MKPQSFPLDRLVRLLFASLTVLVVLIVGCPESARAQYMYLDTNGDGEHSAADVVAPSGTTAADLWIRTAQNRDGAQAVCVSGDGELAINGYDFVLRATNGTISWGPIENAVSQFLVPSPVGSSHIEYYAGYGGGAFLEPGAYRLARLTFTVTSGTPSVDFAPVAESDGSRITAFVSPCSGTDYDNTLKLGTDWQDADGLPYGGQVRHPPRLTPIGSLNVPESIVSDVVISATDEDGDPLHFFLAGAPQFVSLAEGDPGGGAATATLHIAPGFDDSGAYSFLVGVTDDDFRDSIEVPLEVPGTNRPPRMGRWPFNYFVEAGQSWLDFLTPSDPDPGQSVRIYVVSGPRYMRVEQAESGPTLLWFRPSITDVGTTTGTLAATDGYDTVTETFPITVYTLPQISALQDVSVAVGEVATQEFSAVDFDGGTMELALADGPPFVSLSVLESAPGLLRGSVLVAPHEFDVGDIDATIVVRQGQGETRARVHIHVFDPSGQADAGRSHFESTFRAYGVPQAPRAIGWGDFDEDGVPDAAVIAEGNGRVDGFAYPIQILRGNRDGSFTQGAAILDVFGGSDLAVADLDLDSHEDLVVSKGGAVISYRGRGDGSFGDAQNHAIDGSFREVRTSDFNEDGWPDIATIERTFPGTRAVVLLNDGSGQFSARVELPGGGTYPHGLTAEDDDRDGHVDLLAGDFESGIVTRWAGRGDGSFEPGANLSVTAPNAHFRFVDLDGDGDLDLAALLEGKDGVRLFERGEAGSLTERATIPVDSGVQRFAFGDIDRDGDVDLVAGCQNIPRVVLFRSQGAFAFSQAGGATSGHMPVALSLRDVDFDGRLDIATLDATGSQLVIHRQRDDGGYGGVPEVETVADPSRIASGDWNEDGLEEAAVFTIGSGRIDFLTSQAGTLVPWDFALLPGEPVRLRTADLDGDRRLEIVAAVAGESRLFVIRAEHPPTIASVNWGGPIGDFDIADWNRDGHPDLIVTSAGGMFDSSAVLVGAGDGTFREAGRTRGRGKRIAAGDFNGDGHLDFALTVGGYYLAVTWGDASGVPQPHYYYPVDNIGVVGDLAVLGPDRNGRAGLAILSLEYHTVSIYRGGGPLEFTLQGVLRSGSSMIHAAIADLNADGLTDLVTVNSAGNTISLFPGTAEGALGSRQDFGVGRDPVGVAVGDQDGDGRLDLLVSNGSGRRISLHRNLGTARINHPPVARPGGPYSCFVGSPLDVDGTGSADPDGDLLSYRWRFGDGSEGVGARATHTFALEGTYRIGLTVSDGSFEAVDSTTAVISPVYSARVFRGGGAKPLILGAGPPASCLYIEPVESGFTLEEIDLPSLRLVANVSGAADSIPAAGSKHAVIADSDHNGTLDLAVCFTREDLARLFEGAVGRESLPVSLRGNLTNGGRVEGSATLLVIARGGGLAASVRPQPLARAGILGFRLTSPGPASVRLFDARGRLVRTLLPKRTLPAGYHEFAFDVSGVSSSRLPSGIFFFRIETSEGLETGRVLIAR